MFSLLHVLSYVGAVTAFLFVTLSLASGLLWIAELIEEHSRVAKTVGQRAIYAIIVLHALLYITDGLPFWHTVFSIFCLIVYLQHFSSSWPLISLTSPAFILSCVVVIVDHFIWFFHFSNVVQEAKKHRAARYRYSAHATNYREPPTFMDIATFFAVCVWFIPLFLFLSLSANDYVIPSFDTSAPPSPMGSTVDLSSHAAPPPRSRSKVSLVKSVLVPVVNLLPRLGKRGRNNDGLLTPSTRSPAASISGEGYRPWGHDGSGNSTPPLFSPASVYPNLATETRSASGRHTPPPPSRRIPSEPPRSRRVSQSSETPNGDEDTPPKTPVTVSGVAAPLARMSPVRSRTMPTQVPTMESVRSKAD